MLPKKIINKVHKELDELEKLEQRFGNYQYKNLMFEYGYIYLIREREFVLRNEDVYKVGGTVQKTPSLQLKRLSNYKKGSQLLCACPTELPRRLRRIPRKGVYAIIFLCLILKNKSKNNLRKHFANILMAQNILLAIQ